MNYIEWQYLFMFSLYEAAFISIDFAITFIPTYRIVRNLPCSPAVDYVHMLTEIVKLYLIFVEDVGFRVELIFKVGCMSLRYIMFSGFCSAFI